MIKEERALSVNADHPMFRLAEKVDEEIRKELPPQHRSEPRPGESIKTEPRPSGSRPSDDPNQSKKSGAPSEGRKRSAAEQDLGLTGSNQSARLNVTSPATTMHILKAAAVAWAEFHASNVPEGYREEFQVRYEEFIRTAAAKRTMERK